MEDTKKKQTTKDKKTQDIEYVKKYIQDIQSSLNQLKKYLNINENTDPQILANKAINESIENWKKSIATVQQSTYFNQQSTFSDNSYVYFPAPFKGQISINGYNWPDVFKEATYIQKANNIEKHVLVLPCITPEMLNNLQSKSSNEYEEFVEKLTIIDEDTKNDSWSYFKWFDSISGCRTQTDKEKKPIEVVNQYNNPLMSKSHPNKYLQTRIVVQLAIKMLVQKDYINFGRIVAYAPKATIPYLIDKKNFGKGAIFEEISTAIIFRNLINRGIETPDDDNLFKLFKDVLQHYLQSYKIDDSNNYTEEIKEFTYIMNNMFKPIDWG